MSSTGFHERYALDRLKPAPYNPRRIDDAAVAELRRSVREIGMVRPIIAVEGGTIVAGHQRTRACRAEGIAHAPVYVIADLDDGDEVRFNQLHNATDTELDVRVRITPGPVGWRDAGPDDVEGEEKQSGAPIRHEIWRLLNRYGLWGGAVVADGGEVIVGAQYALACRLARRPCRVYQLPPLPPDVLALLRRGYGEFDYTALPREPWRQTYCQPQRIEGSNVETSPLYERLVLPALTKSTRMVDVGCGIGAYVRRLRAAGYPAWGFEPYWRKGDVIDRGASRKLGEMVLDEYARNGPFDVGVADVVVNATGSLPASQAVVRALSGLVKPGGAIFISGIDHEKTASMHKVKMYGTKMARQRRVHFPDMHGQSAIYFRGGWFFQWAATEEAARALVAEAGEIELYEADSHWRTRVRNTRAAGRDAILAAVRDEFDMPYPDGGSLGLGDRAVELVGANLSP